MPPKADVRRLLKKQQAERTKTTKINHPFAKYDEAGRLLCVVCNSIVKSESVWQAHLGSAAHRDNIQKLKALKQQQQQLKRPAPSSSTEQNKRMRVEEEPDKQNIELSDEDVSSEEEQDEEMGLPADFFDEAPPQGEQIEEQVEEQAEEVINASGLPTGFFDDPEEEAKVSGSLDPAEQAKIDLEKDLAEFNEAMVDVTKETREEQEEDDELFYQERQYEFNREQAEFDSRVEKLKQLRKSGATQMSLDKPQEDDDEIKIELKSSVRQLLKTKTAKQQESMFDDDMEDSEEEEEEDWRALQL